MVGRSRGVFLGALLPGRSPCRAAWWRCTVDGMDTNNETGRVVLVTGASSGIGEAVAARLAAQGHRIVAGARRTDRLDALAAAAGGAIHPVRLDVTDTADVEALVAEAAGRFGRVDTFVNNAGVMPLSRLDKLLVPEWLHMLDVDVDVDVDVGGLLHGIAAVLPRFLAQDAGHFVTIASIGAHEVVPASAVYSGTKFAAWAITRGAATGVAGE